MRTVISKFYYAFIRQTRFVMALSLMLLTALVWASIRFSGASAHSAPVIASRVLAQTGQSGRPWVNLSDVRSVPVQFSGPDAARSALNQNSARPLAMASADFDEDGVADFISGYASDGRGLLALQRGNADSIYPNSPQAQSRRSRGESSDAPMLANSSVIESAVIPEFLAAGDFDNDRHADLAAASANRLYIFPGDGSGGLSEARVIELPGPVTAMIGADLNREDGLVDLALAIGGSQPRLMVFEGPAGAAFAAPETFSLPATARSLVSGQFDSSYEMDLAVGAGRKLMVIRGRDRKLSTDSRRAGAAVIDSRSLDFDISSIASGDFTGEQETDLAVLATDGGLHLLSGDGADLSKGIARWSAKKLTDTSHKSSSFLVSARVSSLSIDSLIVVESASGKLTVLTDSDGKGFEEETARPPALLETEFNVEGGASSVLAARLNGDAMSDLVILGNSQALTSYATTLVASTFTVTNNNNSGLGSLRQAIIDANNNLGADSITFAIGSGVQTITLLSDLPGITSPITIDGTTQPGFSGTPIIEINGAGTPSGIGLKVAGGTSLVRGLVINRCSLHGIQFVQKNGNMLEGCYIGTNVAGAAALPNFDGVNLASTSNHLVGGTTAAARNVISGNTNFGVRMHGLSNSNNTLHGNYIGVAVDGATDLGNGNSGVSINSFNNKIGGTAAGTANVISGNAQEGVIVSTGPSVSGNLIQGNIIGLGSDAATPVQNDLNGVRLFNVPNNTVGGTAMGAGNFISENGARGVEISSLSASGNKVQGNTIENNGTDGVFTSDGTNATIGGTVAGAANIISANGESGVEVFSGTGNNIRQNSIFSNTGLGIDLAGDGITANDANDLDGGPNARQNFPVLTFCRGGATTQVIGTLNSAPNTLFTIEFFLNAVCDPSGNGEGETFIGSTTVTTNGSGNASFNVTFMVASGGGQFATATATDPNNNTSEFSACRVVCVYSLSATSTTIGGLGGSSSVNVITPGGCDWTAVSNAAFITITSGSSGSGNGTVNFTVAVNPNNAPRSGTMTVAGITFTVNQDPNPAGCTLTISPMSQTVGAPGGTGMVSVMSTLPDCAWMAVSNDAFITITSGSSGMGNGTVNYSVAANPASTPRSGTLTVAGQTFTVNQDPAPCAFGLVPSSMTFQAAGGSSSVAVNAPGGCNWTAVSNDAFITITSGSSGSGAGTVNYSVSANPGFTTRMGTMTIAGLTFTVTQLPPCTFNIAPLGINFLKAGGTGTITVTVEAGCTWTAVPNVPWITITMGATGSGNGTVKYSVSTNTTGAKRTGKITIGTKMHTVTQSG